MARLDELKLVDKHSYYEGVDAHLCCFGVHVGDADESAHPHKNTVGSASPLETWLARMGRLVFVSPVVFYAPGKPLVADFGDGHGYSVVPVRESSGKFTIRLPQVAVTEAGPHFSETWVISDELEGTHSESILTMRTGWELVSPPNIGTLLNKALAAGLILGRVREGS